MVGKEKDSSPEVSVSVWGANQIIKPGGSKSAHIVIFSLIKCSHICSQMAESGRHKLVQKSLNLTSFLFSASSLTTDK